MTRGRGESGRSSGEAGRSRARGCCIQLWKISKQLLGVVCIVIDVERWEANISARLGKRG
jgi:hypothetical protein